MGRIAYPEFVELCEVGPRDGFQFEEVPIPTDLKVKIIRQLIHAGVSRIQATSFVHPKWVPQMADAEDVLRELGAVENATLTVLVLNRRGLDRAIAANVRHVDLSIATNESHSRDNANMSVVEGIEMAEKLIDDAIAEGISIQMGLQTVFGYSSRGDTDIAFLEDLVARFTAKNIESISLADSTGMANPKMIKEYLERLVPVSNDVPVVLHLHDTRGLGLANVVSALEIGITRFDTSLGGMGGCPFIPGATGNIATEDVLHLCSSLGISTGIAIAEVSECTRLLERHRGATLPGKMYKLV